jgi:hypothetical protein
MSEADEAVFNYVSLNPNRWKRIANDLIKASIVLETVKDPEDADLLEPSVRAAHYILVAFALENYFKAAIVAREKKLDKKKVFNHDLPRLAKEAGINLNTSEKELLANLKEFAIWRGRYPTPNNSDDIRGTMVYHAGENVNAVVGIIPILTVSEIHAITALALQNLNTITTTVSDTSDPLEQSK